MNNTPNDSRAPQSVEFAPLGVGSGNKGRSIDIARFALSMWKPMALGLIGGCLMGFAAYWDLGPTYEANTQVKVSQKVLLPSVRNSQGPPSAVASAGLDSKVSIGGILGVAAAVRCTQCTAL